jgi:hypothetical protein
MTSALDSHFGMTKQTAGKGTAISTDNLFKYFYFSQGTGISPASIVLPLDQEIGAGPLVRDVHKVGVSAAGGLEFIPRADSIGLLLLGALGEVSTVTSTYNTHTFKPATDQFSLPYFTVRRRTGLGGDVASDVRVAGLSFMFRAANFVRATAALIGAGTPTFVDDTSAWTPTSYLDTTPPFLTCKGSLELPTGDSLTALRGSVTIGNNMPTDEQRIIGAYGLDDIEVVSRAIAMTFLVKADADLYEKMMYDASQSGSWTTEILKEAAMTMQFQSASNVSGSQPYQLSFHLNGENEASGDANVAWSVAPLNLQGNRQLTMAITGVVLADNASAADGPFSAQLINGTASY